MLLAQTEQLFHHSAGLCWPTTRNNVVTCCVRLHGPLESLSLKTTSTQFVETSVTNKNSVGLFPFKGYRSEGIIWDIYTALQLTTFKPLYKQKQSVRKHYTNQSDQHCFCFFYSSRTLMVQGIDQITPWTLVYPMTYLVNWKVFHVVGWLSTLGCWTVLKTLRN